MAWKTSRVSLGPKGKVKRYYRARRYVMKMTNNKLQAPRFKPHFFRSFARISSL